MNTMPIRAKPYIHQQQGYEFALGVLSNGKGVAYLMEMGTGKTITSIAVVGTLANTNNITKVLIVAPKSIVTVWSQEYAKFADYDYNLVVLDGSSSQKVDAIRHLASTNLTVVIVNYESAWRLEGELAKWGAELIICDESTKIKNPTARCSKCLHRLGKKSMYNMILTGTPVVNNPLDLFSQYKFLDDSIFGGSYYAFRAKHAVLGGYGGHQVIGYNRLDELVEKAHSIAYRVKLSDAVDLPTYIDESRVVELEPRAKATYRSIEQDCYAELSCGEVTTKNVLTKLLRLSQITGGFVRDDQGSAERISTAKLDALEDIIDNCIEECKKVVVFARFVPEILAIERMVKRKGIGYSLIYGEVKDRAEQVDVFQKQDSCKVFIGQLQTVGMGLTLTAASVAVYYSLDFNYANYEQSRARIHRIGQDKKCLYIHLIASNTVDEKILHALEQKKSVADLVVDNWRQLLGGVNG